MKQAELLFSSAEIHSRIKRILGQPSVGDRRVALVAYVGSDGERYLPHPKGLRLICNPSAGGTDPDTLRRLIKRGTTVEFSDRLHMKVYWSRNRGCVLTSANASSSALGRGGLKEAGIWLPAGEVDIERLIRYARPRRIRGAALRQLDMKSREYSRKMVGRRDEKKHAPGFLEWYSSPHRSIWKIAWIENYVSGAASNVKERVLAEYGHTEAPFWVSVRKNRVESGDWLLLFQVTKRAVKNVEWMYVDFVVKISPKDKRYYEHGWSYHAVEANQKAKYYSVPPFKITAQLRKALSAAVKAYTLDRIMQAKSDAPSVRFINLIARNFKSH